MNSELQGDLGLALVNCAWHCIQGGDLFSNPGTIGFDSEPVGDPIHALFFFFSSRAEAALGSSRAQRGVSLNAVFPLFPCIVSLETWFGGIYRLYLSSM